MSKHNSSKIGKKEKTEADAQAAVTFAGCKKIKRKRKGGILELAFTLWSSWRKAYILLPYYWSLHLLSCRSQAFIECN
ncbi:hypothetical protein SporoP17a_11930 [Sporosarcina ureae]|nr:hypothetical protein SporoP17a_11930 [Sporosarcina ureae]